jgi:hypothetical protein
MEHEETGEPVLCPFCGAEDFQDCGHLVAVFDLTFDECEGGAFCEVGDEFRSALESAFQKRHVAGKHGSFADSQIEELWTKTEVEDDGEGGVYFLPWMPSLLRFYEELLDEAGAISSGSDIVFNGPPGMSSNYVVLSALEPAKIVSTAKRDFLSRLSEQSDD